MSRAAWCAMIVPALAAASCASAPDRRWASVRAEPGRAEDLYSSEPEVRLYAYSPPVAGAPRVGVRDLSDHGQAALIAALASRSAKRDDLLAALGNGLPAPVGTGTGIVDATIFDRTLVITINKGVYAPVGDRLVRAEVTIKPRYVEQRGPDFRFADYTIAATDNRTVNIAHLTDETSRSVGATVGPDLPGASTLSITGSAGSTRTSSADINQQYENLNVDILPSKLTVTRESERGLDIAGNILIALKLKVLPTAQVGREWLVHSQDLFKDGVAIAPVRASLTLDRLVLPEPADIYAYVQMRYVMRHVITGREYYTEGKQDVQLIRGATRPNPQALIERSSFTPGLFKICNTTGSELMATTFDGQGGQLIFEGYGTASLMAAYLKRHPDPVIGRTHVRVSFGEPTAGREYPVIPLSGICPARRS